MNEETTLRIEIKEFKPEDENLDPKQMGLKVCKVRNQQPVVHKFVFSPKVLPHLKEFVEEVRWNSVKKSLTLIMTETPTFAAYRWFNGINERADTLKDIDVDIDADVIYLSFLDKCDKEVARFKFKGICLADHECLLNNQDDVADAFGIEVPSERKILAHALELTYSKVEQLDIKGPDDRPKYEKLPEQAVDEEWKTLEIQ